MGKKKREKGRGAEKAAQKLAKKSKKVEGMEDLEALIAEFKVIDKKKTEVHDEKCSPPSPRINLTMTVHPEKEEILLFGGEYDTGNKTYVFNDLYIYNTKKNEWSQLFVPNPPPPRCAHQAVAMPQAGGQMWVFGGEFASPNRGKFYHYKDLWVLHLQHRKWEQINAPGGPSARSGHRMTSFKKQLIVFGGFHESSRDFVYFNDCYSFDLAEYQWSKLTPSGRGPSPRSGCHLMPAPNGILILGGYSKVKVKKDVDKGTAHNDVYLLEPETRTSATAKETSTAVLKWKWAKVKESGTKPSTRSAYGMAPVGENRAVIFGGVFDEDEEEDISSVFYNTMYCLDLTSHRWFPFELRKAKKTKNTKQPAEHDKEDFHGNGDEEVVSRQEPKVADDVKNPEKNIVWIPCGRMNPILVVKQGILYLFGGAFEEDEKQVTLNDLWSLNLKSPTTWKQLFEADDTSGDWHESDSATSDAEDEKESLKADEAVGGKSDNDDHGTSSSESKPQKIKHPKVGKEIDFEEYWVRTSEHWLEIICDKAEEDNRADSIKKAAKNMAETWFVKKMLKRAKKAADG